MGIFEEEEKHITNSFNTKFKRELGVYDQLLTVYSSFLQATSGKIKDNDFPNWTILILLSQTLPLMDNGIKLLKEGYLRSSEILIRVASEAIILSTYFKEFPETEVEYRTINYRDFFHKHNIDDMLKKVEKEGKVFISNKAEAKKIKWSKIVFTNTFKEASRFVHNNPNVIYDLTKNNSDPNSGDLIMGPQLYSDDILSTRPYFLSLFWEFLLILPRTIKKRQLWRKLKK